MPTVAREAVEFVDDLRSPIKETESRLDLRATEFVETVAAFANGCRGSRGVGPPDGELLTDG